MTRIPSKYQKVDILTPLIQIGLFDRFEPNRRKIIGNLSNLFTFVNELGVCLQSRLILGWSMKTIVRQNATV